MVTLSKKDLLDRLAGRDKPGGGSGGSSHAIADPLSLMEIEEIAAEQTKAHEQTIKDLKATLEASEKAHEKNLAQLAEARAALSTPPPIG